MFPRVPKFELAMKDGSGKVRLNRLKAIFEVSGISLGIAYREGIGSRV